MTTLYLKYRPQKISELDLTDVRELLQKIVSSGEIPHAFLFEGPRGSGKTSAARIIAKVLNCEKPGKNFEPCNKCDQCRTITKGTNIDVIELDAASHRGIDDIRLVRESVKLAPAKANKKVYIVDEAHMLTTEASNALLKTLEEPPEHVVFILATTNPEKLLDTIKSRTVRVNFKKATKAEIVKSLENVLKSEKKKFQKEVLELVANSVDGSFRDAKKLLEELIVKGGVNDIKIAENHILNKRSFDVGNFIKHLHEKDLKKSLAVLDVAESAGVPSKSVYSQVVSKIKDFLFSLSGYKEDIKNPFNKNDLLKLTDVFMGYWSRYQNDVSDFLPLYLFAVEWCGSGDAGSGGGGDGVQKESQSLKKEDDKIHTNASNKEKDIREASGDLKSDDGFNIKSDLPDTNGQSIKAEINTPNGPVVSEEIWKKVLEVVRSRNASTEALLRASKPESFDGKKLTLGVFYKFHKEKLESNPHRMCLEDCLQGAMGRAVKVECFLVQQPPPPPKPPEKSENNGNYTNGNGGVVLSETEDSELAKLAEEVFGN